MNPGRAQGRSYTNGERSLACRDAGKGREQDAEALRPNRAQARSHKLLAAANDLLGVFVKNEGLSFTFNHGLVDNDLGDVIQ